MTLSVTEVRDAGATVLDEVERAVVGQRTTLQRVLVAILAGGHVLLEDVPGLGKTLTARTFAAVLDLDFRRIQFTPDLMPADVTGSSVWDQHQATFDFRPGPIFCNLLLADEINRTPPKTQSALLEAMGEHQVSVEGSTRVLDEPFVVLATQNPIEYEGTYPLPEAQLDRFLFRLTFGYPDADQEWSILQRRLARDRDDVDLRPVLPRQTLLDMRATVEQVHLDPGLGRYLVALSEATRVTTGVEVGVSPRGTLALMQAARAHAALVGRDYVVPEDVKALAEPALAHRIVVRPDHWVRGLRGPGVVRACLDAVPAPAIEDVR